MGARTMMSSKQLSWILLFISLNLASCAAHTDLILVHEQAYKSYHNQDFSNAAKQFESLLEKAPEDGEYWFRLANCYARTQNPHQAIIAYQNALLRSPDNEKAWYNMGLVQTQTALKTFVDMQQYTERNSSIGKRSESMRQGLFKLLGPEDESAKKE